MPEVGRHENPESEFKIEHRTTILRDQQGKPVAELNYELRDDLSHLGVWTLEKLSFKSPDGNREIRLDEILLVGETKILISKVRLENYHYSPVESSVLAPPLESGLDIGVLLHELGHAVQSREEQWQKYSAGYEIRASSVRKYPESALLDAINALEKLRDEESLVAVPSEVAQELIENKNIFLKADRSTNWREGGHSAFEEQMKLKDEFIHEHFPATKQDLDGWINTLESGDETVLEELKRVGIFLSSLEDRTFVPDYHDLDQHDSSSDADRAKILKDPQEMRRIQIDVLRQLRDALFSEPNDETPESNALFYIPRPHGDQVFVEFTVDSHHRIRANIPFRLTATQDEYQEFARQMSELEEKQIKLARAYKQLQADNERLYQNTLDLFLANEDVLARDLERPRKMIERDATRRALVWLRELKQKHGIDLTGIFEFSEASNARLNLAERDVELEVIESLENAPSISKDLFASLRTYKAGKGQMTKQEKRKISRPKNL
jgi:hypothetical protein